MNRNNLLSTLGLAVGAFVVASAAHAAPVVTSIVAADSGQTLPAGVVSVRTGFESNFASSKVENFSGATPGNLTSPATVPVFGTGTIAPSYGFGETYRVAQTNVVSGNSGRFDTTCAGTPGCTGQWYETTTSFRVNFGGSYNGFGFYGTDVGDFNGAFQLQLLNGDAIVSTLALFSLPDATLDGGSLFYGFFDNADTYTGVNILITQRNSPEAGFDVFGFDDMIVGTASSGGTVPEPGSLALVGASLLALGGVRRRRAAARQA